MIVHLDADAFFASVEQAADPKLRGKPVAVGGERRGIIASASYEARKLGIYTPMRLAGVLDGLRENHSIMRGHDLWLKQRKNQPRTDTERRAPTLRAKPSASRVRDFVPLNIKSYYSFLDSALSIPAIIETAVERGIKALAITDPNLHGAVEFFTLASEAGIKPIIGAELHSDGQRLNAYAANSEGYAHLCEMLSMSAISAATLKAHGEGLIIVRADSSDLALPEIRYRLPGDRPKLDVIQSIRTLTRLHEAHPEKRRGDFHFPTAEEVAGRWHDDAIRETHELAERCEFAFEFGRLRFPHYAPEDGSTPHEFLARLAHEGLHRRYGERAHTHEAQLRKS